MPMPDIFNFDIKMKDKTFVRDVLTIYGNMIVGYGKSFPIYFYGWGTINQ